MNPQSQSWLSANIKSLLGILVVIFAFTYFFYCAATNAKPDPQILIAVVGASGTVLGYFFGSSQGSSAKNEIIASTSGNPAVNTGDNTTVTVQPQPDQPQNKTE